MKGIAAGMQNTVSKLACAVWSRCHCCYVRSCFGWLLNLPPSPITFLVCRAELFAPLPGQINGPPPCWTYISFCLFDKGCSLGHGCLPLV